MRNKGFVGLWLMMLMAFVMISFFIIDYSLSKQRVRAYQEELARIEESLESHNHRLNKLEHPELVRGFYKAVEKRK